MIVKNSRTVFVVSVSWSNRRGCKMLRNEVSVIFLFVMNVYLIACGNVEISIKVFTYFAYRVVPIYVVGCFKSISPASDLGITKHYNVKTFKRFRFKAIHV